MKKFIVIAILLLPYTALASEWTPVNTALELTYATVHVLDWGQTLNMEKERGLHEQNSLLGSHPSHDKVNAYFAATLVAHAYVAYKLPEPWRMLWQAVWIKVEADSVESNRRVSGGLHVQYNF